MPARYAIHKLIVTEQRGLAHRGKIAKDLAQAASLVLWLATHEPGALAEARADAMERGPSWRKSLKAGWARLQREFPAAASAFEDATSR